MSTFLVGFSHGFVGETQHFRKPPCELAFSRPTVGYTPPSPGKGAVLAYPMELKAPLDPEPAADSGVQLIHVDIHG